MANISGNRTAFYLAAGGTSAAVLPYLNSGDAYGIACGVNAAGQVVGLSAATFNTPEACLWTQTTGVWGGTALPSLTNAASPYSQADAISNNGVVVGWGYTSASGGNYNLDAVSWSYNTSEPDLDLNRLEPERSRHLYAWIPRGHGRQQRRHQHCRLGATGRDRAQRPACRRVDQRHIHRPRRPRQSTGGTSYDQANGVNDSGVIVVAATATRLFGTAWTTCRT